MTEAKVHAIEIADLTAKPREPFSPRDLVLSGKWTSALFTTYSLSLSFFESVPFAAMARSVRDATVLTDVAGYAASLSEAGALGVGRNYEVIPIAIAAGGVFHPKIVVLVEQGGPARAMIGSGNLTFGGWGYNAEVVDVLVPGADSRAYADLADFLGDLAALTGPSDLLIASRKPDLSAYIEACAAQGRRPGNGSSRLLHTLSGPTLAAQIAGMASDLGGALGLTVVSPYFSVHHGVAILAAELACNRIAVAVPSKALTYFDFAAACAADLNVVPVICDGFDDKRRLHAKLFDIECRRGRLLVSGSANATVPALAGNNIEAVVARVVDRAVTLGWRPTTVPPPTAGAGTWHDGAPRPCLAAHFNCGNIQGLVFGVPSPGGTWSAFIRCGSVVEKFPEDVEVAGDGTFRFPPQGCDPAGFPTAIQLVLERGGIEARGWLMHSDLLRAIKAKGPAIRALARMLGGVGVTADVVAVLEYFAQSPANLIEAAMRQGGGRQDRRRGPPATEPTAQMAAWKFDPVGVFDEPSAWTGDAGSVSAANLMDAVVRSFATSMPDASDDGDDDEEEMENQAKPRNGDESRGKGGTANKRNWVPEPLFRRAFNKMAGMLATIPVGLVRVPALHVLFDMVIKIAPRCEDTEVLTLDCFKRWMELAHGCRTDGGAVDALDRSVALVPTQWTMDGVRRPVDCHSELQRWFGRPLDAALLNDLEPDPDNPERWEERRLAPRATAEDWKMAWRTMTAAVTPFGEVSALYAALRSGKPWECPKGVEPEEEALFGRIANRRSSVDRLAVITARPGSIAACPRCNTVIPLGELNRLHAHRIASCRVCQRVLFDLSM